MGFGLEANLASPYFTGGMNVGGAMNVAGTLGVADQIQFNYSNLPTLTSNSIGYTATFALATTAFGTGTQTSANTNLNLPVGVYQISTNYQVNHQNGSTNRIQLGIYASSGCNMLVPIQWSLMSTTTGADYFYFTINGVMKVTNATNSVCSQYFASGGAGAAISTATLGVVRIA